MSGLNVNHFISFVESEMTRKVGLCLMLTTLNADIMQGLYWVKKLYTYRLFYRL